MRRTGTTSRIGLLAVSTALMAMSAPGLAQGASYKFKVDLSVLQDSTDWQQELRWPRDGFCGEQDVHYVFKNGGDGELKLKVRGARVTFKGTKASVMSSLFRVPGTVISDHTGYSVSQVGTPDDQCSDYRGPIAPPATSAGACSPLARRPGSAKVGLYTVSGRLGLLGGFTRKDKKACPDATLYTGVVGMAGRARRKDVTALIMNKRVRSIELTAATSDPFTVKNLSDWGANTRNLAGSGKGKANWKVKLTRIY